MLKKPFGWTGVKVPVLGQGTWMIENQPRAIEALLLGLDRGMTHIDTAEMYGDGRAEEVVGEAIAGRRGEVFLVSKVLPENASYRGTLRACKQSLKRLKTEWLDLYLLHWAGPHPIAETMRAMEELVDAGAIRFFGVSNFDVDELQAAERAVRKHRLACDQVLYHLGDRGIEHRLLPYCKKQAIAVVGYSPFGHGRFPPKPAAGAGVLARIARKHGRTPRQIALNFLTRDPDVFSIPKAGNHDHVRENAGGAGWSLDPEDTAAIDRAYPAPTHDVPLGMI